MVNVKFNINGYIFGRSNGVIPRVGEFIHHDYLFAESNDVAYEVIEVLYRAAGVYVLLKKEF